MYQSLLVNASFYHQLVDLDRIIADQAKASGCPCHGTYHQSNYARKPRGIPAGVGPCASLRFSFCCSREGCRKRLTPPSLRFLGRKVYSSAVILLIFKLKAHTNEQRVEALNNLLRTNLSVETIRRWRRFWTVKLPANPLWQRHHLAFYPGASRLPESLFDLTQGEASDRVIHLLRLLLPLSV